MEEREFPREDRQRIGRRRKPHDVEIDNGGMENDTNNSDKIVQEVVWTREKRRRTMLKRTMTSKQGRFGA